MTGLVESGADRFRVARSAYTDPAVFAAERERIFSRCWLFVGHESELAVPDAFRTRRVGGRPILFLRDSAGAVRCFLNICPHRGAQITREKGGKSRSFTCLYHGWTFDNAGVLRGMHEPESYPPGFCEARQHDLVPVPRFESYRGFHFLNFDAGAMSLRDYLGGACDYIDTIVDQAEGGMRVIGEAQEYSARANWKLLAENSVDIPHVTTLHPTYLQLVATNSQGRMKRGEMPGYSLDLGHGHAVVERIATYGRPIAQWIESWGEEARVEIDAIYQRLVGKYGKEQADRMAHCARNLLIFPNLVINDIMSVTIRSFEPTGPAGMDISAWALAPAEELGTPALGRRLTNFLEFLGPGGFATPDDVEALESCQRAAAVAKEAPWNDLSKGLKPGEDQRGDTMSELPLRAFWRGWQHWLQQDHADAG